MVLFVSDMHFGLGSRAEERAVEAALVACLRSFEARTSHLYLVGDVFERYIEYRRLVPKGFVRFMALLAAWTDRGIGVTYLVGNHDPWHQDYFATELGIRVVRGSVLEQADGVLCHVQHGDGLGHSGRGFRAIRPLLRNRAIVSLYRSLLPADIGLGLAHSVSTRLRRRRHDPNVAQDMRRVAEHTLEASGAQVVVLGHSHHAELRAWPAGAYMNTGCWRDDGSFGLLHNDRVRLMRWQAGKALLVAEHHL